MINKCILLISFLLGFFLINIQAQQERPITYAVVNYMKVATENEIKYLTLEKEVFKKLHKERIKKGQLFGWYLFQVLSPRGAEATYNYVTVDMYLAKGNGLEAHFESWDLPMEELLNEGELARLKETDQTRTMVKQEIFQYKDGVWKDDYRRPAKFTVINYMKLKPDLFNSRYAELESKYWKPIHAQSIKEGNMAAWAMYYKQFPLGEEEAYDAATVDSYDHFNHTLESHFDEIFPKVHPDKNKDAVLRETTDTRSLVKREVRLLVDFVQ